MVVPSEDDELRGAEDDALSRAVEVVAVKRKRGEDSDDDSSGECCSDWSHGESEFIRSSFLDLPTITETATENSGLHSLDGCSVADESLRDGSRSRSDEHVTLAQGLLDQQKQDDAQMYQEHCQHPTEAQEGIDAVRSLRPFGPMPNQQPLEDVLVNATSRAHVTHQEPGATPDVPFGVVPLVFQRFAEGYLQLWLRGLMVQQLRYEAAPVHPLLHPNEAKKAVVVQDEVKKAVDHFKMCVSHMMDFKKGDRNGAPILPSSVVLLPGGTIEGLALPHMERAAKYRPYNLTYTKDEQAPKTKKRKSIPLSTQSCGATATSPESKGSPVHRTPRARKKVKPVPFPKKNDDPNSITNTNCTRNDQYHEGKNIDKDSFSSTS